ncbi:MAG: ABC transporter ATP-binding protein [Anaerolineaceae bacterium]|jgi:branched-chain amino acid transport system ATP-binding protein|nr:ABC transporter ATP-binding protein [Anaerolineae bacterium]MDX9830836.1 ABC transporter ATP-binding protein [Anaerolineae bacterium]NLF15556.1 ABC transporter ATP-binding protein [Anaerolineaceae bacterium]
MALLEIHDIHSYYGAIHALKGISVEVEQGEIVTLIGANGAGKSTTLNTVCGILHPRKGTILFDGEPIQNLPAHQIVARGVSQAPEGRRVFGRLNVTENLEMGAFARKDKEGIRRDIDRVFTLFPRLKERHKQVAGTLSGGEQQMLAIGRSLMASPRLLLLDEPSMGLAPILVETIFDTVSEINKQGTTVLLVEQNALMALSIARRGYVMETGSIVLQDSAAALEKNEMVRKAYLGEE